MKSRIIDQMDAPSAITTCRDKIAFLSDVVAVRGADLSDHGRQGLQAILAGIEEDLTITMKNMQGGCDHERH